jgi:hypothetical protein
LGLGEYRIKKRRDWVFSSVTLKAKKTGKENTEHLTKACLSLARMKFFSVGATRYAWPQLDAPLAE